MHEMSIVESLMTMLQEQLRAYPESQVRTVCVRVGQLRQVEPAMLQFCYGAAVRGTALEQSTLDIQVQDASARCDVCSLVFPVEENWFECPRCRSTKGELLSGDELQLMTVELVTPGAVAAAATS